MLGESLVSGLQRVIPADDDEDDRDSRRKGDQGEERLALPQPEMDEASMLKALQSDRDGPADGRL